VTSLLWRHLFLERITQVFCYQQRLVGDIPFHLKFALTVTHFLWKKRQLSPISAYNVSTVRASEKCSIIANIKSTTRFPTSYRWCAYITPNSPKWWFRMRICHMNKIQVQSNKVCYKVYVKTFSGKIVVQPFPYLTVYRCWQYTQPFDLTFSLKVSHPIYQRPMSKYFRS